MIQTLKTVKEYKESLIAPAIREMLEALDIAKDLRPGMKVVIKPNLVMAKKPDAPVTTHPLVVKAVAEWLREQGIEDITLAESSGGVENGLLIIRLIRIDSQQIQIRGKDLLRHTAV